MKVLITVPRLAMPGGVANYYRALRNHLDADKVFFEVGTHPTESGVLVKAARLVRDTWSFHRALARDDYDLVHVNPSMVWGSMLRDGLLMLIALAHRRRVLVFFRGWDPACAEKIRRGGWLGPFRRVYGRAAGFIVLAEEFKRELAGLGIDRPTWVATTVVDEALIRDADVPARSTLAGDCNVLFLCRLDTDDKGLPEAIDAFARCRERHPRVTLNVVGDGPLRAPAEATVASRKLSGIAFLGHVDGARKIELFRKADIYLFPAVSEGMPNSLLEAMASGLPVITRPVGGIRDFFENDRMGFITESRDPAVFADLLDRLIGDPALRLAMGAYNRDYARRNFAAPVVARKLLQVYAALLDEESPRHEYSASN